MKKSYGKVLRTLAVGLFSLTLIAGNTHADSVVPYQNMIATAVAMQDTGDQIRALSAFISLVSNVDEATAQAINANLIAAINTVNTAAEANESLHPALHSLLASAAGSTLFDDGQKAAINGLIQSLNATLSSDAKTLDPSTMTQLAQANQDFNSTIAQLKSANISTADKLSGVETLLAKAPGNTFDATTQGAFGDILTDLHNSITADDAALQSALATAVKGTPLLSADQSAWIEKNMVNPASAANASATSASTAADNATAAPAKKGKKSKKSDAAATNATAHVKGKKGKHSKKHKSTSDATVTDASATDATAPVKGKKGKHSKKHKDTMAVDATATNASATAPVKAKKHHKKNKAAVASDVTATDTAATAAVDAAPVVDATGVAPAA